MDTPTMETIPLTPTEMPASPTAATDVDSPISITTVTVHPTATDSMVTVSLSDGDLSALPSPMTPTVRIVDETEEEHLVDGEEDSEADHGRDSAQSTGETTSSSYPFPPDAAGLGITQGAPAAIESTRSEPAAPATTVDWEGLERTEGEHVAVRSPEEAENSGADYLLARLEQENKKLETDPKAHINQDPPAPSYARIKNMMENPDPKTLRYSQLPMPPPLTDLDFYTALVSDYKRAALKLPNLVSRKIRGGIPPPLRGVVWQAMSGARDSNLEGLYDQLLGETSPYEHMIGKDIGRTGLEMFRQEGGDGQRMLARVLRAFSIYDTEIGYCQGLGFLVGPLLMHMGEKEAFCVLVRLMEHYDLRSCFIPGMYGLQLRMFQFTRLLAMHMPDLAVHLSDLGIQPTYASQWFLSLFAVTCPLPMLFRIYDIIFSEGAPQTMMRVALSIMKQNESKLLASSEFEDVMQMLLSRSLWDPYHCNADTLVTDFTSLSGMVTRDVLQDLETNFKAESTDDTTMKLTPVKSQVSDLQAAATRFLGRIWGPVSPGSSLSTVSSFETTDSSGTTTTEATSRCSSIAPDDRRISMRSVTSTMKRNKDEALHGQIEDLLVALSHMQRDYASKVDEIEAMKADREEERALTKRLITLLGFGSAKEEDVDQEESVQEVTELCDKLADSITKAEAEDVDSTKPTMTQLTEDLQATREQLRRETAKCRKLQDRASEQEAEVLSLKTTLHDTRRMCQEIQKQKESLQKTVSGMRQQDRDSANAPPLSPKMDSGERISGGLRELRLGRSNSFKRTQTTPVQFSKRTSSLINSVGDDSNEQLVMELVQAKTAEAMARQEAEEAKAKLEQLRKVLGGGAAGTITPVASPRLEKGTTVSVTSISRSSSDAGSGGGWFGWGKRSQSSLEMR